MTTLYVDNIAPNLQSKISAPNLTLPTGSVVQVVNTTNTTHNLSIDTSTFTDTGIQVQITPSATSSKVLLLVNVGDIYKSNNNTTLAIRVTASDGSTTYGVTSLSGFTDNTNTNAVGGASASFLYTPSTTSQITYKLQFASPNGAGGTKMINARWNSSYPLVSTTMTAMEIAG